VVASGSGIANGNGDLNAGHVVTLTVNLSEAVTVAGGTPTLTLNDGGTATYMGGSGTNALTFSYTVAAGQNTAALAVTAANLNSATVTDAAGNAAVLTAAVLAGTLQIDTTAPTAPVISSDSPATGTAVNAVTLTGTAEANSIVTVYERTIGPRHSDGNQRRCLELYDRHAGSRRIHIHSHGCGGQRQRDVTAHRSDDRQQYLSHEQHEPDPHGHQRDRDPVW
jgi:hypothetical protein